MNIAFWWFNAIFIIMPALAWAVLSLSGLAFVWLILNSIVAVAAATRGRLDGGWFLLSCLITPLFAVLFLLALPNLRPPTVKIIKE